MKNLIAAVLLLLGALAQGAGTTEAADSDGTGFWTPLIVGDSITNRFQKPDPGWEVLWPNWLTYVDESRLPFQNWEAIGGEMISRQFYYSGQWEQWTGRGMVERIDEYISANPDSDSFVLQGGNNDLNMFGGGGQIPWQRIRFAWAEILMKVRAEAHLNNVLVWNVPDKQNNWLPVEARAGRDAWNAWIGAAAVRNGLQFLDVAALTDLWDSSYYRDNSHPNQKGAQAYAAASDTLMNIDQRHGILAPDTSQDNIRWDESGRSYDGVVASGTQVTITRTTGTIEVLPINARFPTTGKYYAELRMTSADTSSFGHIGLADATTQGASWDSPMASNMLPSFRHADRFLIINDVSTPQRTVPAFPMQIGETVHVAIDADAQLAWLGWQGQWFSHTGDPADADPEAGIGGIDISLLTPGEVVLAISTDNGDSVTFNMLPEVPYERIPVGFSVLTGIPPAVLLIDIDVQPTDDGNFVGTDGNYSDKMFVSIEGSAEFDATQVDTSTVKFGPAETSPHTIPGDVLDTNNDGIDDMRLGFLIYDTGLGCENVDDVTLKGETNGGLIQFEGSDTVTTDLCDVSSCHP